VIGCEVNSFGVSPTILLAWATLPGVFPPVRIQVRVGGKDYDELHVDGGITRQVSIAPSIFSFASGNQKPGRPVTKQRLYVIRNGKIDPEWQLVSENVLSITTRSISTLIKNQGVGDLYRIYSITKRDGIDFNLASIPPDFNEVHNESFDPRYMNALFARGYDLASRTPSWVKFPPGLELAARAGRLATDGLQGASHDLAKRPSVAGRPHSSLKAAEHRTGLARDDTNSAGRIPVSHGRERTLLPSC